MEIEFNAAGPYRESNVLPHAFIDPKGKIDVRIHVANQTIPAGTELDLKIAFTSYQGEYCLVIKYHVLDDTIMNVNFENLCL